MTDGLQWRAMRGEDMPAVSAIAAAVHTDFFEGNAVFAERLTLYPAGCFVLERAGEIAGYGISHPWTKYRIPALNTLLGRLPDDADIYYLHDIALMPEARSGGFASRVIEMMAKQAERDGFNSMALVAVNGSPGYWQKQGFAIADVPELTAKLLSYSEDARYMVRVISAL